MNKKQILLFLLGLNLGIVQVNAKEVSSVKEAKPTAATPAATAPATEASTVAMPTAAPATAANATLHKIKENKVISLGVRESSIPFSYTLGDGKYAGYSYDVAQKIVAAAKDKLKLKELAVKTIPITSQNRIPLLQNGTIDIECGSTTNNLERQKQAAFTNSIFVIGTRLMVRKGSEIKDFDDLKSKTVVTTAGTTSERLLRKMNDDKKMGMNIISAKDHAQSDLMLENGRAVAFMMDDALLYGEIAKAKNPSLWTVVGTPQSYEAYGCMLRKEDPEFKKLADDTIAKMMKTGEMAALYNKWFMKPVPPKGMLLNFPLSDAMKKLYAEPNDKAFE